MAEIKKKWIKVISPKILNNVEIGETLCTDPNKAIGRVVEVSVGSLVNDMRRNHMKLKLRIKQVENGQASTEVIGYDTVKAYIKRAVRKGRSKIEDSFVSECKNKVKVRIKPLIITRYKAKRSVLTELRKRIKEFYLEFCKKINYEELISSIINNKIQKDLKKVLKKIFPVAFSEIRMLKKI